MTATVNVSVRELYVLSERLLSVIGVAPGAAGAAARLVAGAEIRRGEGLRYLAEQLDAPLPAAPPRIAGEAGGTTFLDCQGLPAPLVGFAALDLCQVNAFTEGVGAVVTRRVAAPSLLASLDVHAAQRGLRSIVLAADGDGRLRPLRDRRPDARLLDGVADCVLVCVRARGGAPADAGRGYWWLAGAGALSSSPERAAMTQGVDVDGALWERLWTRSAAYLVPESARSRLDAGPYSGT